MNFKNNIKTISLITLLFSLNSSAYYMRGSNSFIYRTPGGGPIIIQKDQNGQKGLQGAGMMFNGPVRITTEQEEDPETKKPKEKKVFKVWIRNCGEVTLSTTKEDENKLKDGDRVELRFEGARSCTVASWRRFYQ